MVDRFAEDWRGAGLEPQVQALLFYCEKLTRRPADCGAQDISDLRDLGWTDRAINDAIQVCSYFNYINRIAEGLGVDDEAWLDALGRALDGDAGAAKSPESESS